MLIIGSVLRDTNRTLPVSVVLENYHGFSDICLSVPVIVVRTGVVQLLHPHLLDKEVEKIRAGAAQIHSVIESVGMLSTEPGRIIVVLRVAFIQVSILADSSLIDQMPKMGNTGRLSIRL